MYFKTNIGDWTELPKSFKSAGGIKKKQWIVLLMTS